MKVGKERSSRKRRLVEFGLGLLASRSKKWPWLPRRRRSSWPRCTETLNSTKFVVLSEQPAVVCHGKNLIISTNKTKPNL